MACRTILVIVDNAETHSGIGLLLEKRGHKVIEAANDAQAVEKVRQEQPDLILMDTDLPAAKSLVTARGLRERARLHEAAIVVATTQKMARKPDDSSNVGPNDYVVQQGDFEQLKNILHRLHPEMPALAATKTGSK